MADFCQQCSIEVLGEDYGDLSDIWEEPTIALCEGCGMVIVNSDGRCIDPTCPKHGTSIQL